jgi:hypothetical protein
MCAVKVDFQLGMATFEWRCTLKSDHAFRNNEGTRGGSTTKTLCYFKVCYAKWPVEFDDLPTILTEMFSGKLQQSLPGGTTSMAIDDLPVNTFSALD